jgi:LuxR family maltose regulon positive regulatory protein
VLLGEVCRIQAIQNTKIIKTLIDKLKYALKNIDDKRKNNSDFEINLRELDALKFVAQKMSNQQIADKLYVSLNTVKTHLKNINLKLDVSN